MKAAYKVTSGVQSSQVDFDTLALYFRARGIVAKPGLLGAYTDRNGNTVTVSRS